MVACSTTGSVKTLKDTFSSAEAARQAEQSEMQRVDRGAATLILALGLDRLHLMPQAAVTVEGSNPKLMARAGWSSRWNTPWEMGDSPRISSWSARVMAMHGTKKMWKIQPALPTNKSSIELHQLFPLDQKSQ